MRLKQSFVFSLVMLLGLSLASPALSCTTVIVGKQATDDGSIIVSHSVDGAYDSRIKVVQGGTHEAGEMVPVYQGMCTDNIYGARMVQIGEIPQVPETYTYVHSGYPFMNEHKLVIGEDTWGGSASMRNSEGLMYIEVLQMLALQRAKTAREAIQVMSELAETYGYGDGGETLTISDGTEAWVFDIIGPGALWARDSGEPGAIWVAQRVPDDHIYTSANRSRVQHVDLSDTENFMGSANMVEKAIEYDLYNPDTDGEFSWAVVYDRQDDANVMLFSRREWRVFTLLIPSLDTQLDPFLPDPNTHYEFSYQADHPVNVRDVIALYRDYYQGTQFDLSAGMAGGPFGNPGRAIVLADQVPEGIAPGQDNWERAIGIISCSYTFVAQTREWMPNSVGAVAWIGEDAGHSAVFMPLYSGATRASHVLSNVDRSRFETESAWNAFSLVTNWATTRFDAMMDNRIRPLQQELEDKLFTLQPAVEKFALSLEEENPELARAYLTDYCASAAEDVTRQWWDLAWDLLYNYQDGLVETRRAGYPTWWLEEVGFGQYYIFQ